MTKSGKAKTKRHSKRETWPVQIKLLHGSFCPGIDIVKFRKPTGYDIQLCGDPVRIDANGDAVLDERKITVMMAVLSGVPLQYWKNIDPRDWNSCAYRLRNFFLPDPNSWLE